MKRNFIATLAFSQGVPMILGGDEIGRTQRGNNNAYCQDNEISWLDWNLEDEDRELLEFTRQCFRIFRSNPVLRRRTFFTGRPIADGGVKDLTWVRPDGREMTGADWADSSRQVLGMLIDGQATDEVDERGRPVFGDTVLLALNGSGRPVSFTLPEVSGAGVWQELLNTARPGATRVVRHPALSLVAHSLVLVRFGDHPIAPSGERPPA